MSARTMVQNHTDKVSLDAIQRAVEHASRLLPAQGPITVFVHHNTLHALEHLTFEKAASEAGKLFGCRSFLSQQRYREEMARGRILPEDIDAALLDCLGDHAEALVGFLGTRFNLRRAILLHPFQTVLPNELDWVIAESRALDQFSSSTDIEEAQRLISRTQRWITRLLGCVNGNGMNDPGSNHNGPGMEDTQRLRRLLMSLKDHFDFQKMSTWSNTTWQSVTLRLLWLLCQQRVSQFPRSIPSTSPIRHRDILYGLTGTDSDLLVHEALIRFCLAVMDQGLSRWQLPRRGQGILHAFHEIYGQHRWMPSEGWLRRLSGELQRYQEKEFSPLASIQDSLFQLGVEEEDVQPFLLQTLLALRGFAGMIWQMEKRRDRIAHPLPVGSLIEFLAVRLLLDRLALEHLAFEHLPGKCSLADLRCKEYRPDVPDPMANNRCEAFAIFQLAQGLGWQPESLWNLTSANWMKLLDEIRAFDEIQRLSVYHSAFERRYQQQCLDAIQVHCRDVGTRVRSSPSVRPIEFDVITCIDEREESFRRHLEEVAPSCRTWAAAGFFSIAMYYRSAESFQYVPLCPIVIEPQHHVMEVVTLDLEHADRRRSFIRRQVGTAMHAMHSRSRMLFSGAVAALFGTITTVPLVARVLFPRLTGRLRNRLDRLYAAPAQTCLQLESFESEDRPSTSTPEHFVPSDTSQKPTSIEHDQTVGFTVDEMATIVERQLRDIGMTAPWSRLVIVLGHGSSTMNNPHESAYDCGACGGGRGGPNARAFAQMANDPRVRRQLATRGDHLPLSTCFIGGFHNTCNDQVHLFDLARVPASHRSDVHRAQEALQEACLRNAHERCRRFESASLKLTRAAALKHVKARSEDLSQVRPECGHATNAVCFVGRRQWTRGLFMDRRCFLQSYDPRQDDADNTVLARILAAVLPVCAGINLEYYFSHIDPEGYGCGTKLPHNIAALVGVMNGAASDLRPGLPWQMVDIHEPMRLLVIVETSPAALLSIMSQNPAIKRLVFGRWIHLAALQAESGQIHHFHRGKFELYESKATQLPKVPDSIAWYRGWRGHLDFAQLTASLPY